jgi:hypothetical protein
MSHPSLPYLLPFAVLLFFLAIDGKSSLPPEVEYPLRLVILTLLLVFLSRHVISFRTVSFPGSIALGVAVFAVWIGPDLAFPGWRQHWLFQNSLLESAPVPDGGYAALGALALFFRMARAVVIVPIVEELFWRAWLMRWLIKPEFSSLPLGAFSRQSFAITAVLFAAEHGSFWDVGLLAGMAYNYWMVRTKSLGDCILAHAITNACLSAYVLLAGKWHYW